MKRFFTLLLVLACLPVLAGSPYLINPGGMGTNTTLFAPTFGGAVVFSNSAYHAGGPDAPWFANRATGPGISTYYGYAFGDNLLLQGGLSGIWAVNRTASKYYMTWGSDQAGNADDIMHLYQVTRTTALNPATQDHMTWRAGDAVSAYIPYVGGSASMMAGQKVGSYEKAARLPQMPIMIYCYSNFCTEGFVTNNIAYASVAAGCVPVWKQYGAQMMIDLEPGWQQSIRDPNDGTLMWNTNSFPDGPVNFIALCHTNGFMVSLHQYCVTVATNGDFYTVDAGMPTPSHNCPATTLDKWTKDVKKFYQWGVDEFRCADENTSANTTVAYRQAMLRGLGEEILYPQGADYRTLGYTNKMHQAVFCGGDTFYQEFIADECTLALNDNGPPASGTGVANSIDKMRVTWTNFAGFEGKGHYISAASTIGLVVSGVTAQWTSVEDCRAAMAASTIFPGFWVLPGLSNAWYTTYAATLTNTEMLKCCFDAGYYPGFPSSLGAIGDVTTFVKPLASGGYAVAMCNERGTNFTMTLDWSTNLMSPANFVTAHAERVYPVLIPTNSVFAVRDVWGGTNVGAAGAAAGSSVTNSFSFSVPASTVRLFRMYPKGVVY